MGLNQIGSAITSFSTGAIILIIFLAIAVIFAVIVFIAGFGSIGPTQRGLVTKWWSRKKLTDGILAFKGEAGYQAKLLSPGIYWVFRLLKKVEKYDVVQIGPNNVGIVIAQVGKSLESGQSGIYKPEFGCFTDLNAFLNNGGQQGIQKPALIPGFVGVVHPVAFLVVTRSRLYGKPISEENRRLAESIMEDEEGLLVTEILQKEVIRDGAEEREANAMGVITVTDGPPLPPGNIAGRIGGFDDILKMEKEDKPESEILEAMISSDVSMHNGYQDLQAFMDAGGRNGIQVAPILPGRYNLNRRLVRVERKPMLVVKQGEVAVIKSLVGLPPQDISGEAFKHGIIVNVGHRGIWDKPLTTGMYAINPHCFLWEIVPTSIITLNFTEAISKAHALDSSLNPIRAKSQEGFEFLIDLQVQIHVSEPAAPWVISIVGTISNLVTEVLQAAVTNYFNDILQSMAGIKFIQSRQQVEEQAFKYIEEKLKDYHVTLVGVLIQSLTFPEELSKVLKDRGVAEQEIITFEKQKEAQLQRVEMEKAKGMAEMQEDLAKSEVEIEIQTNKAEAKIAEGKGQSEFTRQISEVAGVKIKSEGMAQAEVWEKQRQIVGTAGLVAMTLGKEFAQGTVQLPQVVVMGDSSSGPMAGLLATLTNKLTDGAVNLTAAGGSLRPTDSTGSGATDSTITEDGRAKSHSG